MVVGDDDIVFVSGSEIDVVGVGSVDQDQFQFWVGGDVLCVDWCFVVDCDLCIVQLCGDFLWLVGGMQLQFVEGGVQGVYVQVVEVEGGMVEENGVQGMVYGRGFLVVVDGGCLVQ